MTDLFDSVSANGAYTAKDIEVLEGLEPVRRRPGMFIGGTDEAGLHHLVAEVVDNAVDEVVAGHASWIEIDLAADGSVSVGDNGRGIPVDPHPKFPGKSALEVILTTLHSGGKFSDKVYRAAGGLHGVGLSVVNALSDRLDIEVARDRELWTQSYVRGQPRGKPLHKGRVSNRRGTLVRFHPDPEIFGADAAFQPSRLYRMAQSKAYLVGGVEIRWRAAAELIGANSDTPAEAVLHFPRGLRDYLELCLEGRDALTPAPFAGAVPLPGKDARVEWAIAWPGDERGLIETFCNAVPTPLGGTHEAGLRSALLRGLKSYAEIAGARRGAALTADDILGGAVAFLSLYMPSPQFQGQTKEKLTSAEATKLVETTLRDHFEHWLSATPDATRPLLDHINSRAEDRVRRREESAVARKTASRRLRLPGKLADCSRRAAAGTEVFLVEGDSAGGTAKQARNRETQAVLPLRGKILNVASASPEKIRANQELADLVQALGCGLGDKYRESDLRYERVVIMTDADVDGAHIASLLMTFFYRAMPQIIENGHLHLALPPLYRLSQGDKTIYARDDAHRDEILANGLGARGKVEISRFKGLGEMPAVQLRDTTMAPGKRGLLRVTLPDEAPAREHPQSRDTAELVECLMGRKPELRLAFIQENARFVRDLDV